MRTFAQRHNQIQKSVSSDLTRPSRGVPGQHHHADPAGRQVTPDPLFNFARTPITPRLIQRKPIVSSPGDVYEREADEVADIVLRRADAPPIPDGGPVIQRKCQECEREEKNLVQRKCMACEFEEKKRIQTKPMPSTSTDMTLDADTAVRAARHGGVPLPNATRSSLESSFGHDFSRVRIHADGVAAEGAHAVRARAYTIGRDIVFAPGEYMPDTLEGKRLLAHELTHVVQQRAAPSTVQGATRHLTASPVNGVPGIQRKVDCSLEHLDKECGGAADACLTAKDYCTKKYPTPQDIEKLHANAVAGANAQKDKFPNAADNLLHFLDGSGTEKVMKTDLFRNHDATKQKYGVHMAKFLEGAKKRFDAGQLKIGGPAVEMVWTDTANAFTGDYNDLGLAVGGYTLCSKVSAKALDPKSVGGSPDFLWVRFDPWIMQAFDCYNWDPGKGIGLPFATDKDLCCLENAGRGKHFRVRTEPWTESFPIESIRIAAPAPPPKPPAPPPSKPKDDDSR